jgi:ubiquinol oxidase
LAAVSLRGALHFNAEFEDHAEHEYARFVEAHPEWEHQPVHSAQANPAGELTSWADVFRQIGLDERAHRNHSFLLSGRPEHVVDPPPA